MEFWKNDILPFDPAKITTNYVVGEDGTQHPDFELVLLRKSAKYHHNCILDIDHIIWQGRKNHYKVTTRNLKWGNLVPFSVHLWTQIPVHLQFQQFQILFVLYAMNMMPFFNVHAAGAFHASKWKLSTEHVIKLTNNWRDIAVYIGNNVLVSSLVIGDLGVNCSFYHKRCSANLFNRFTTKQKEECKGEIDIDHVKAAAWDKVIAFMKETLPSIAKQGFDLHEFENI